MSQGFNFSNILLIIAGIMLATTLFVVVLVLFARWFDWSISVSERLSSLLFLASIVARPCPSKEDRTANHAENQFLKLF